MNQPNEDTIKRAEVPEKTAIQFLNENASVPKPQIGGVLTAMKEYEEQCTAAIRSENEKLKEENARYIAANSMLCDSDNEAKLANDNNKLRIENTALRKALSGLLPIVEFYHDMEIKYTEMPYKEWGYKISYAKTLLNPPDSKE